MDVSNLSSIHPPSNGGSTSFHTSTKSWRSWDIAWPVSPLSPQSLLNSCSLSTDSLQPKDQRYSVGGTEEVRGHLISLHPKRAAFRFSASLTCFRWVFVDKVVKSSGQNGFSLSSLWEEPLPAYHLCTITVLLVCYTILKISFPYIRASLWPGDRQNAHTPREPERRQFIHRASGSLLLNRMVLPKYSFDTRKWENRWGVKPWSSTLLFWFN